jgi:hypothetical protein
VASIAIGTAMRWLGYRRWVFPAPTPPVVHPGTPVLERR